VATTPPTPPIKKPLVKLFQPSGDLKASGDLGVVLGDDWVGLDYY